MANTKNSLVFLFLLLLSNSAFSEVEPGRFFIGTSAFMLANLTPEDKDPPHFSQLNIGYRITDEDVVSVEFIGWRYYAPLGAPLGTPGEVANDRSEKFPGHVDAKGIGLAYQCFVYDKVYTALHATWFDQNFVGLNNENLGSGKQLFLTLRLGYHYSFGSDRFFIEPSLAVTHWPINTNLPTAFQAKEDKWPKYQVEPGLHVGFVF